VNGKEKETKSPRNRRSAKTQTKRSPRKKSPQLDSMERKTEREELGDSQKLLFDSHLWTMLLDLENMEYTPIIGQAHVTSGLGRFGSVTPKKHRKKMLSERSYSLTEIDSKQSEPHSPRGRPTLKPCVIPSHQSSSRGRKKTKSRKAHSRSKSWVEHPIHKTTKAKNISEFPEIPDKDLN